MHAHRLPALASPLTAPHVTYMQTLTPSPLLYPPAQATQGFTKRKASPPPSFHPSSSSASSPPLLPKLAMASSSSSSRGKGVQVYMDIKIGQRFAGRMVFEVRLKSLPSLPPFPSPVAPLFLLVHPAASSKRRHD